MVSIPVWLFIKVKVGVVALALLMVLFVVLINCHAKVALGALNKLPFVAVLVVSAQALVGKVNIALGLG